ncbi:MAG: HEAT repeat domain-containing protein, partial [Leptospiraceae bacterium]|nr:HEAT repeat domain-containing protein [Leptospiraceae bacterium]
MKYYSVFSSMRDKMAILRLLAYFSGTGGIEFLEKKFESEKQAELRGEAILSLLRIDSQKYKNRVQKVFEDELEHSSSSVLISMALNTFSELGIQEPIHKVRTGLLKHYSTRQKKDLLSTGLKYVRDIFIDELLQLVLKENEADLKRTAALNLEFITIKPLPASIGYIKEALKSKDDLVLGSVSLLASRSSDKSLIPFLLSAYKASSSPSSKRKILIALRKLSAFEYSKEYLSFLKTEKDRKLRKSLHRMIANSRSKSVWKGLSEVMYSSELSYYIPFILKNKTEALSKKIIFYIEKRKSIDLKKKALSLLAIFPFPKIQVYLKGFIEKERDDSLRSLAIEALGEFKDVKNESFFYKVLSESPASQTEGKALIALAILNTKSSVDYLSKRIRERNNKQVIEALTFNSSERGIGIIKEQLNYQESRLKNLGECMECEYEVYILSKALFKLNSREGLKYIEKQLKLNNNPEELIRFLGKSKKRESLNLLKQFENHPSRSIRLEVMTAIQTIEK